MSDTTASKMEKPVEMLRHNLAGLRTGRASAELVTPLKVDYYGGEVPLQSVAAVSVPEPRLIQLQVFDKGAVPAVEKAIQASGLGITPRIEGTIIRLPLPELTEQRRKELLRVAKGYAEDSRVAVRNLRRDALESYKKLEKDKKISEDESRRRQETVQKQTDRSVKTIDEMLAAKEKEILQV